MDRLSDLPDNVIEAILERLSIRDAVRTGFLSKKWRYKWETVSRLRLDYAFFDAIYRRGKPPSINYFSLVKIIMLQHQGPLLEFLIYIPELGSSSWADINLLTRCALKKGVRELSMTKAGNIPHILPSVLFSAAAQLTKLKLLNCTFNPPLTFEGFPNLKFLELNSIDIPNLDILSSFISSCQELRSIRLVNLNNLDQPLCIQAVKLQELHVGGRFGSISLKQTQCLVSLVLYLEELSPGLEQAMPCKDTAHYIFGKLSKLRHLKLGGYIFDLLAAECLPRKLSPGLDYLETIVLTSIDLRRGKELRCLLCLIRSSRNLQELKIIVFRETDGDAEPHTMSEKIIYAESCLQNLRRVRICELIGSKAELELIEHLLGCSPVLDVMLIEFVGEIDKDAKVEVLQEVTRFCRASPRAQLHCKFD